jgi:flagellar export protein FliJ
MFKFRLQPVLEQRERIEQEKQRRFSELERERIAIEETMRACQQNIRNAKVDLRDRLGGNGGSGAMVVIPEVRAQANASLHMEAKARQTAMALAGAYKRLEYARAELLRAATDRRAVELLRDRWHEEWRQAERRADAARVDEAGMQLYVRRQMQEQGEHG